MLLKSREVIKMSKAMRMLNYYEYKELLLNGNPQWENFYKDELIGFLQVAKELLKEYKQKAENNNKAIEYIKENSYLVQDKEFNGIPLMSLRLDKCCDLLEILGSDKE